jgi:hypothetical protein
MSQEVANIAESWPTGPKESAQRLLEYYGRPDEFSKTQLIWSNTHDGWKRAVLSSEGTPHEFPKPHSEFLEQFMDYRVPIDMFSPLAEYDGSVIAERTRGEISARCGGTSMNFVAINLAHDIVTRKRTVAEARAEYVHLYDDAYQRGEKPPYTQAFEFELAKSDTVDRDRST